MLEMATNFTSLPQAVVTAANQLNEDDRGVSDEEQTLGPGQQAEQRKPIGFWPTSLQIRLAAQKMNRDLAESGSGPVPISASSEEPSETNLSQDIRAVGTGPLALYHRGVAVRMLTDYLQDLVALNSREQEDIDENVRQQQHQIVQKRVEEYRAALMKLEDANNKEPNGQLTWEERDILKHMLEDYSRSLEEALEDPDDQQSAQGPEVSWLEEQIVEVRASMDMVENGLSLDFKETSFSVLTESLTSALEGCEAQLKELLRLDSQGIYAFNLQCNFLVKTLSPNAQERLLRFRDTLQLFNNLEGHEVESSTMKSFLKAVAFCVESLYELARTFQTVEDLVSMCSVEDWWRTALKLSNAPPQFTIPRWSPFSFAVRSCEWSLDITTLAFHALEKLVNGASTLDDVVFKWSDAKLRTVLDIRGKPLYKQEGPNENSVGLHEIFKDLETTDRSVLVQRLVELRDRPRKMFKSADANMHSIANFLSQKLDGPVPQANSLPYTFRIDHSTLTYTEYIDSGSSGMVAKFKWLGEQVAVKSVRAPGLTRKKFEEEAAILATVQHPNVVQLIGCGYVEKKETGMLVMELMEHDLRTVIEKHCPNPGPGLSPFPLIVAVDIMLQIAEGMLYLRDHKILHRDLKAKNILINRSIRLRRNVSGAFRKIPDLASLLHPEKYYVAKLADFGIAKARPFTSVVHTKMAGTTSWRAPEVFLVPDTEVANYYKWPADVYSFAMTCYEILSGRVPFDNVNATKVYQTIMAGERPSLEDVKVSPLLKDLLQRCWATDPNERPNFAEICRTLWQCKVENILPVFIKSIHVSSSKAPSLRADNSM